MALYSVSNISTYSLLAATGHSTELAVIETTFPENQSLARVEIDSFNGFLEDFDLWNIYLKPTGKEWFLIFLYVIVFAVSLTGNSLIVIYILRRKCLQTTVNYFVLNLALADILVTVICLPPTLMVDFFETWLLGATLCKLTPYLQMVVTCVSSFSLGAIAINRWFVVCHPLKAIEISNLKKVSTVGMILIWGFSLLTLSPVAFQTKLQQMYDANAYPELEILRACVENWQSSLDEAVFHIFYITFCYALPLLVLAATYSRVFRVLRRAKIPGYVVGPNKLKRINRRKCNCKIIPSPNMTTSFGPRTSQSFLSLSPNMMNAEKTVLSSTMNVTRPSKISNEAGETQLLNMKRENFDNCNTLYTRRDLGSSSIQSPSSPSYDFPCKRCSAHDSLVQSRRRCAFMQVALVVVFGVCYAPVMILNLLRRVFGVFGWVDRDTFHLIFALAHLFMYLNSALNPIIYNFFSGQFREEFKKTFRCFFNTGPQQHNSTRNSSLFLPKIRKKSSHVVQL